MNDPTTEQIAVATARKYLMRIARMYESPSYDTDEARKQAKANQNLAYTAIDILDRMKP